MKHIFHFNNIETEKHYVYKAEQFCYVSEPVEWMLDPNFPNEHVITIPSPDIIKDENKFVFDSEAEAMEKIALLYGQQSKEIRLVLEASLDYITHVGYGHYQEHGGFPQSLLMEHICDVLGKTRAETMKVIDPDDFCGKDNVQRLLEKHPLNEDEIEELKDNVVRREHGLTSSIIPTIANYRYRTGLGLKVAKEIVQYVVKQLEEKRENAKVSDSLLVDQDTFYRENQ